MYPVVLSPRGEKYLDIQMYCRYRNFLIFKNKWIFLNTAVHLNLRLRSWGYQLCIYVPSSTISARREVSRYSHVPQVRAFPYFLKKNSPPRASVRYYAFSWNECFYHMNVFVGPSLVNGIRRAMRNTQKRSNLVDFSLTGAWGTHSFSYGCSGHPQKLYWKPY